MQVTSIGCALNARASPAGGELRSFQPGSARRAQTDRCAGIRRQYRKQPPNPPRADPASSPPRAAPPVPHRVRVDDLGLIAHQHPARGPRPADHSVPEHCNSGSGPLMIAGPSPTRKDAGSTGPAARSAEPPGGRSYLSTCTKLLPINPAAHWRERILCRKSRDGTYTPKGGSDVQGPLQQRVREGRLALPPLA